MGGHDSTTPAAAVPAEAQVQRAWRPGAGAGRWAHACAAGGGGAHLGGREGGGGGATAAEIGSCTSAGVERGWQAGTHARSAVTAQLRCGAGGACGGLVPHARLLAAAVPPGPRADGGSHRTSVWCVELGVPRACCCTIGVLVVDMEQHQLREGTAGFRGAMLRCSCHHWRPGSSPHQGNVSTHHGTTKHDEEAMSEESEAAAAAAPWGSGHIRTRRRVAKFHPPGWIQELAGDLSQLRAPDCGGHEGMEGGQLDQLSLDTCRPPPSIAAAAADSADCSLRGRRRPRWLLSIVTRIHQQLQQQLVECAGGWALALALQSAGYTPARAGQGRGGVGAGDRIPDDGPTPAAALLLLLKRLVRCQLPPPRPVTATSQLT